VKVLAGGEQVSAESIACGTGGFRWLSDGNEKLQKPISRRFCPPVLDRSSLCAYCARTHR
jgi:hypothetical protein